MASYYEDLRADMVAYGFESIIEAPLTYGHVIGRLSNFSAFLSNAGLATEHYKLTGLRTQIGRKTLAAYITGVQFATNAYPCCGWSESYLLDTVAPNTNDAEYQTPLIVTNNGEPVAVWKSVGDPTFYGLIDDYEHGIIAGAYSTPTVDSHREPKDMPRSQTAWTIDVDQIPEASPVRFSIFAVPMSARGQIEDPKKDEFRAVLQMSHGQLQAQVAALLKTARAFEPQLVAATSAA